MLTTTVGQILAAYEDRYGRGELQDVPDFVPDFEGTWDAFYELCELGERIIKRESDFNQGEVKYDA